MDCFRDHFQPGLASTFASLNCLVLHVQEMENDR
jgi:hypothetical protein